MKAAVFRAYDRDPTKIVRIEEMESPKPKPNEVIIEVHASAYNHNDLWAMYGDPIKVPLPHISGSDAAGIVIEKGDDVTSLSIGDKVVSHANISCRVCSMCTSGREFDCQQRKIWGSETGPLWGGFAQQAHLPEVNALKIPDNLSFEKAAAVSMTGLTAWHMLVGRAKIRPGQTVLIMGGGSGIGSIGIQIAKLFDCTVLATSGNAEKIERCLRIGADQALNHREQDWNRRVREITKKQGVDVIFEHLGGSIFSQEVGLLKMGGTLVTAGATTGFETSFDLRYLFYKGVNLMGSTQGTRAELEEVIKLTADGKITPVIDTIYPFSVMTEGHVKMIENRLFGKLLTTPQKL